MGNKELYIKLIECYINEAHKGSVEEFYGVGSKIKISNLNFGVTDKSILVSMTIILGETINEQVMEKDMAELLLIKSFRFFLRDAKVTTVINCDV